MLQYINNRATYKGDVFAFKKKTGPAKTQFYCIENETWEDIVYLSSHGYTIGRASTNTSFIFFDIDNGNAYKEDLENAIIGWRPAVVLPSTSRDIHKHHVLVQIPEISISKEDPGILEGARAREAQKEFRAAVRSIFHELECRLAPGKWIVLDDHSEYYWQCLYASSDYDDFEPDAPAECGGNRLYNWIHKYRKPHYIGAEDAGPQFIPSCPRQLNRMYGKHAREGLRLDWDSCAYGNKGGEFGMHIRVIPKGKRGKSLDRLCMSKAYYAHYCNTHYGGDKFGRLFTVEAVIATVLQTIKFQFEEGRDYLDEKGPEISHKCTYFYDEISRAGLDEFARRMERLLGTRLKNGYSPRSREGALLFESHADAFSDCPDKETAIDLAYRIAEGDVKIANSLLRRLARTRNKRMELYSEWSSIIKNAPKDEKGRLIFPKRLYRPNFIRYLKKLGINDRRTWR